MSDRILIRGGCVLTLGTRTPNHPVGDVLIDGGRVVEVGPNLRARGAEQVDASHCVVMPGFVDTHRHLWKSLFRHVGETGEVETAPEGRGTHYRPDDLYAATLVGLLGAVEAGITTVVDWADIRPGDDFVEAALQAHEDSGIRTVLVHPSGPAGATQLESLTSRKVGTTTFAFGADQPTRQNLDRVAGVWARAREIGMRVHAHVGADAEESGVVAGLGERGLLGPEVTLIHCSLLAGSDLDAIAMHRVKVSLAPTSEMVGGSGLPPMQHLIDRNIRPGLGVGSERISPGDIFAQMRAVNSVQHATHFDLKLAGKGGLPNLLTTRDVIKFATVDGAAVAGLGDITGSIEVGKQADVIVLRTDRPNIWPINDPIGAVVWGMDTSNLDWVICAGRILMREGRLTADVERARELAIAARRRLSPAVGPMTGARTG